MCSRPSAIQICRRSWRRKPEVALVQRKTTARMLPVFDGARSLAPAVGASSNSKPASGMGSDGAMTFALGEAFPPPPPPVTAATSKAKGFLASRTWQSEVKSASFVGEASVSTSWASEAVKGLPAPTSASCTSRGVKGLPSPVTSSHDCSPSTSREASKRGGRPASALLAPSLPDEGPDRPRGSPGTSRSEAMLPTAGEEAHEDAEEDRAPTSGLGWPETNLLKLSSPRPAPVPRMGLISRIILRRPKEYRRFSGPSVASAEIFASWVCFSGVSAYSHET
mmetsp:Transcript_41680/g.134759  ORF Transcript_41680/g.134759 Transcript_41680/m.134759 type:complete len:280 (-) Transcript_41680:1745-2584(-)